MRRAFVLLCVAGAITAAGCQGRGSVWFGEGFDSARSVAADRGTLVMVEFYTDWCGWCMRMDRDTFSDSQVRQHLRELVPLRLDAESEGRTLARRYGVDSFPTMVFTDAEGDEIDRIIGYLPPEQFIAESSRIRAGDTLVACLARLSDDPSNADAVARAVVGLLERSDPESAIARVKAYHATSDGHDHELCRQLMFKALAAVQSRSYGLAAKRFRSGWQGPFEVSSRDGTRHLKALVDEGLDATDRERAAARLREARRADAGDLLATVSIDEVPPEELFELADFAFQNGQYEAAGAAYERWFGAAGDRAAPGTLNEAAWQLYLSGTALDLAEAMARRAFDDDPNPGITDTLARVIYLRGAREEAIELQRRAVEQAEGDTAEEFREVMERMEAGRPFGDRPGFESYPIDTRYEPTSPTGVIM